MMANFDEGRLQKLLDYIKEKANNEAKALLQTLARPCRKIDDAGTTLLHYSVEHDNAEMVQHLIDQGSNPNVRNNVGVIPLMLAMQKANSTIAEILLKNHPGFYTTESSGDNSLLMDCLRHYHFAPSHLNQPEELKILKMIFDKVNIDFSANKSKTTQLVLNSNSMTKLAILACANEELSRIIIKNRHPLNLREPQRGLTALHCAIILQNSKNVKFLIDRGASADVQDTKKLTALSYYIPCFQDIDENSEVLKNLLRHNTGFLYYHGYTRSDLEYFLRNGNRKTVETVLKKAMKRGIDFYAYRFNSGQSVLHILLDNQHAGIFEVLDDLDLQCNLYSRASDKRRALADAVMHSDTRTVEFLLNRGADPNPTIDDAPVLFFSLKQRRTEEENVDTEILELLLQYGADAQHVFNGRSIIERLFSYKDAFGKLSNPSAKIIIAHLALLKTINDSLLTEITRRVIKSNSLFQGYFVSCEEQLSKTKNAVVHGNVMLFNLLTEDEEKIVTYARHREFISAFDDAMKKNSHLESYYRKSLIRRVAKVSNILEMEKKVALVIGNLTGINSDAHFNIVSKIISYLSSKDKYNLRKLDGILISEK